LRSDDGFTAIADRTNRLGSTSIAPSGDKPVRGAEIRPSASGTIQNQQLMPEQDGFGENCPHASGTNETNKDGNDMDE